MKLCLNKLDSAFENKNEFIFNTESNSGKNLCISHLIEKTDEKSILVITEDDRSALSTYKELKFFSDKISEHVRYLPDAETLPYDTESPHVGLVSERSKVFNEIMTSTKPIVLVLSANNAIAKISNKEHWVGSSINISLGDFFKNGLEELSETLESLGYKEKEIEIDEIGEFSHRNKVLDLFPLGSDFPVRVKFKENSIQSISKLNLANQLSEDSIDSILILPAKEMPVNEDARVTFRRNFRSYFSKSLGNPLYDGVSTGNLPSGIEAYLSLFQKSVTNIFEIFSSRTKGNPICFYLGNSRENIDSVITSIDERYNSLIEMENRTILPPNEIWMTKKDIENYSKSFKIVCAANKDKDGHAAIEIRETKIQRKETLQSTLDLLGNWIDFADKIVFCLHSGVREEQVKTIFELLDCDSDYVDTWKEAIESKTRVSIVNTSVDQGYYFPEPNLLMITEKEIFGQPIFAKLDGNTEKTNNFQEVQDLINLNLGDPIVHLKYGVGRFNGLETTSINGIDEEFMTILYAESAKVFVRMTELDLVSRYAGSDYDKAPLDSASIESKWMRSTKAAKKNVVALAKSLINIQANRVTKKGKEFKKTEFKYLKFCQEFPFQETQDQKSATEDIINDLRNATIMDRVVCGDVGFGKTEVAMRAAFYVANNGYQVAILAPTTLLAQQHFENFKQRFSSFPSIKIIGLFGTDKSKEREALKQIESGKAHIVIGTHKLIQPDVKYNNLGIAIIDEEHRFGVKQKEHFRSVRKDVNLLSMTATPIPRTLSMSMHGIRDISIISTPPAKRLAIRTFLEDEKIEVLTEAVNREKRRGGQIFYLHNRTETIQAKAEQLQLLFPELRVKFGHGKMKEAELESLMSEFYRGEFDILVATTIIETGIDIPNANTILIEKSENFGIAQLHQLRGRVGRSHHQAYCYLLRGEDIISESAEKRLIAMTKATKLGEGFVLANHDLEIRGAGEILGEEQSGQIEKIGFALYLRLLERAIQAIKNGIDIDKALDLSQETLVDINMSAFIESSFIENDRARLSLYKRVVSATTTKEISDIYKEIEDKYGFVSELTQRFMKLNQEKINARNCDIKKIMIHQEGGFVSLVESKESIVIENMLDLVVSNTSIYKIKSPISFEIHQDVKEESDRFHLMHTIMEKLSRGKST